MKLTIRCKSLREVSNTDGMPVDMAVALPSNEIKTYVEASFEGHKFNDNINFYISLPSQLLDDKVYIGDEYEVTFNKVVK